MKVNYFEELNIWNLSRVIVKEIYSMTQKGKLINDYNLANQCQRASISINANIAEGFERNTRKEFIQFLIYQKDHAVKSEAFFTFHQIWIILQRMNFNN